MRGAAAEVAYFGAKDFQQTLVVRDLARALKDVLTRYDNLFEMPFPYLLAIHQAPTDGGDHDGFHLHFELQDPDGEAIELIRGFAGTAIEAVRPDVLVVDESLAGLDEVSLGAGAPGWAIHLAGPDLVSVTGATVAPIAAPPARSPSSRTASARKDSKTPIPNARPWLIEWLVLPVSRSWEACWTSPSALMDSTGSTQGIRFRISPPSKANPMASSSVTWGGVDSVAGANGDAETVNPRAKRSPELLSVTTSRPSSVAPSGSGISPVGIRNVRPPASLAHDCSPDAATGPQSFDANHTESAWANDRSASLIRNSRLPGAASYRASPGSDTGQVARTGSNLSAATGSPEVAPGSAVARFKATRPCCGMHSISQTSQLTSASMRTVPVAVKSDGTSTGTSRVTVFS